MYFGSDTFFLLLSDNAVDSTQLPTTTATAPFSCNSLTEPAYYIDDIRYDLGYNVSMNFTDAQANCAGRGGNLAILRGLNTTTRK